jgi:hypothetical protein
MPPPDPMADVRVLTRRVDALLAIVTPILTGRVTVAQQARMAGVSRVTLWRRRRRAAAEAGLKLSA